MTTPESNEHSDGTATTPSRKECRYCREDISAQAWVCHHCRHYQHKIRHNLVSAANIASLLGIVFALVTIYMSRQQLDEARQQRIAADEAQKQAETASQTANKAATQASEAAIRSLAAEAQARDAGQTAETASRQAAAAAEYINRVEAQVVSQSATIDQVAQQAHSAKALYEELKGKGRLLEANLEIVAARQQDRLIPQDRRNQIIEKLVERKGSSIKITSVSGDEEAAQFAQDLHDVFKKAGWEMQSLTQSKFLGGPVQNITVFINNMEPVPLAHHIVSTFTDFVLFNTPPIRLVKETEQKESLMIIVGTKTIPPLKIVPD